MISILFVIAILLLFVYQKRSKKFPTGPIGIPGIGATPFIGRRPEITLQEWGKKFGNLFGLRCFSEKLVVICSFDVLYGLFVTNGNKTSDRPDNFLLESVGQNSGLSMRSRDANWKEQKRFTLNSLRKLGFGKSSMEKEVVEEMLHLLDGIRENRGELEASKKVTLGAIINVLSMMTVGQRFGYDDQTGFFAVINNLTKVIKDEAFGVQTLLLVPLLRFFPYFKRTIRNIDKAYGSLYDLIDVFIEQHKKSLDEDNPRDLIDDYLIESRDEIRKGETNRQFTGRMLRGLIRDLFVAGTETTANTLSWSFLVLSNRPKLQAKIFQEIEEIVGGDGIPAMALKDKMHLTQAFMQELFRYRTLIPLALPHSTSDIVNFMGYELPAGTTIIPNIYAVHHNNKEWENPGIFNPYRHLGEDNHFVKSSRIVPFGLGPRSCPGKHMGLMQYFIFMVGILQRYQVVSTQEGVSSEDAEESGLVLVPPIQSTYRFLER